MKKLLASALALTMTISASTAFAGGPVIIAEEGNPEVIADKPASSVGILPLLLIPIVLCAVLCGGDDDDPAPTTPPDTKDK
jgi:hypothetical protein